MVATTPTTPPRTPYTIRPPCIAISSGNMNRIIGPTRPMFGAPAASVPKPPSPSTGVQPVSMKNAVMKPQAMNAAMFGMIMPERKVPNFCTATRAPPVLPAVPTSAFAAIPCLRGRAASTPGDVHRTALRRDRSPAAHIVGLPALPGPRQARSPMPPPTSPSAPFLASLEWKPPQHEERYCPGQAERPTANQLRHAVGNPTWPHRCGWPAWSPRPARRPRRGTAGRPSRWCHAASSRRTAAAGPP